MAKTLTGIVSSDAADKTITVSVHTRKSHPLYKKQYSATKKFLAHDEKNECKVGDKVIISETRPISARKKFRLSEIVDRAKLTEKDKQAIEGEDEQEQAKTQEAKAESEPKEKKDA